MKEICSSLTGQESLEVIFMNAKTYERIFRQTAYVRMGGSEEELNCAKYLQAECEKLGLPAEIVSFPVDMSNLKSATLTVDGKEITCKGYLCAGSGTVEAPLYYLTDNAPCTLAGCKGKIVIIDGYLGYWRYQDMLENGAVGFITYDGNANYADRDIDQRELRSYVSKGNKIPGVNINAKDAIALIRDGAKNAKITLEQEEYQGESHNVIADLPGTREEYIVLTAHYDSTSLSQGAYDNMSGCAGLLGLMDMFKDTPHSFGLRFIFCGSEERGLLGSRAYCESNDLAKIVLNVNLDMIGCIMGKFIACCTTEEKLVGYLQYLSAELGFGCTVSQDVYSSDSTPFADKGVPALSFARIAPGNTATIHNSYDTQAVMSSEQMVSDVAFIGAFVNRMANAAVCPIKKEIPDNMKEKLDEYLMRKRPKNA